MPVAYGGYLDRKSRRALEQPGYFLPPFLQSVTTPPLPNPRGYPPGPIDNRTQTTTTVLLFNQDRIYGAPGQAPTVNLPNPKGYPPGPVDNRTQVGSTARMFGQDTIYGAPGQAPTVNLPNPPLPPRQNPQYEQGRNLQVGLTPFALPPGQVFTTNPRLPYRQPTPGDTYSTVRMIGQDRIHGDPGQAQGFDWPNPMGYLPGSVANRTSITSTTLLIGQDRIFGDPGQAATYDWPNPLGYRRLGFQAEQGTPITSQNVIPPGKVVVPGRIPPYSPPQDFVRSSIAGLIPPEQIAPGARLYPNQVPPYPPRPWFVSGLPPVLRLLGPGKRLLLDRYIPVRERQTRGYIYNIPALIPPIRGVFCMEAVIATSLSAEVVTLTTQAAPVAPISLISVVTANPLTASVVVEPNCD